MIKILLVVSLFGIAHNNVLVSPSDKISDSLLKTLELNGVANIVIKFNQDTQPILDKVNRMQFETRGQKITFIKSQLEKLALESQQNVASILKSRSQAETTFQSFWINNKIIVKNASQELIKVIAANQEVSEVREELIAHIKPISGQDIPANNKQDEVEWGVGKIEADQAWNLVGGNNGQGVVVSTIGTGARYTHETLQGNYRESYGWYDALSRTRNPNDLEGHGTHTLATVVGSHGVGVAPGAQWISCRACTKIFWEDFMRCEEGDLLTCGEWVLCPTSWSGSQSNCSMAPNVASNSWSVTFRGNNPFYSEVVNAWHAANIIPIFEIGNGDTGCRNLYSPGDYPDVIGVGAVNKADVIPLFSSRGPSRTDGRIKPDLVAPGDDVRSAWISNNTSYYSDSGTSVACSHVAGTVALLLARNPDLTFSKVKNLLLNNTDRELGYAIACGGTNHTVWPNNLYGYGRVNARKALMEVIEGSS